MQRIGSIELPRGLLVQHIDLGGTLAMMVTIGLALVATGSLAFGVAVRGHRTGVRPADHAERPAEPGDSQRPQPDLCIQPEPPTA